ncbi:MAG: YgjP-like metallopeptidase domain-containing protein [Candidatus Omnitrophota bacterium]|nr:YgjP-like metallopeptidase domain-containing protein [Candidatus Omnitrophota bacterium]
MYVALSMARSEIREIDGAGSVLFERSARSKHLNIFVIPFKGVRVAIPYGISFEEAERIVRSNLAWVRKHMGRMIKAEREYRSVSWRIPDVDGTRAKEDLLGRVDELAREHGFIFNRLFVRNQKTLWGSCSRANNISINVKLAQLPDELAEYVILHELMHTRIKNHGKDFWRKLDSLVGDAKGLDAKLKKYHLGLF